MRDFAARVLLRLLGALPLLLGVSLVSFVLMALAPDKSYELAGRAAGTEEIAAMQRALGYDAPLWRRYLQFLGEIARLDFGHALSSGERVTTLLARTAPVSLAATLPGFVLGHALALAAALLAARWAHTLLDRLLTAAASLGMSLSLVVVVIACQAVFSASDGLDWFPVRGWDASSIGGYLRHVAVPTTALALGGAAYNLRFYRSLMLTELEAPYVRLARAYGEAPGSVLLRQVLPNLWPAIATRLLYSIPLLIVSGSLLIESYFGIPGLGRLTYEAATGGDQPVLKAVVTLSALLFALTLSLADAFSRAADPRLELR